MKRVLVPLFPGTNCERETLDWIRRNVMAQAALLRPEDAFPDPGEAAAIIVPGGFSHGDYLRAGALAARSPQMAFVRTAAAAGVPVLGICNGFQILCEAGLLPGVLLPNAARHHLHGPVPLVPAEEAWQGPACAWLPPRAALSASRVKPENPHEVLEMPISCGMGRYFPGSTGALAPGARPLFRYAREEHPLSAGLGSFAAIAGLVSADGLVAGMMPHPERASDPALGGEDGLFLLAGLALNRGLGVRPESPLERYGRRHDLFA